MQYGPNNKRPKVNIYHGMLVFFSIHGIYMFKKTCAIGENMIIEDRPIEAI